MIKIVGKETGKVYAEGYKADCFRELQKKYPYKKSKRSTLQNARVYPEALLIVERVKEA